MNYRRTNIVIILIFALIIACPLVLTNTDPDAISAMDNKTLADNPLTVYKNGEATLSDAVENYMNDRIGLRQSAIKVNSRLDYYVFRKSPTDSVVFGKDGWLFYQDVASLNQVMGLITYNEEQLEIIANNLQQMKKYLEARQCEFIFYVAPSKERAYFDELPDYYAEYKTGNTTNTEQIVEYLRNNTDIKVVWPYEDIKEYIDNHPDQYLYYKLDTHWNKLGGYIGAKALLDELNIEIPDLDDQSINQETIYDGDLYDMLGLSPGLVMNDNSYTIDGYEYVADEYEETDFYGNWEYKNTDKDSRKLMIIRDSFCTAMADYISDEFNQSNMIHRSNFNKEMIDEISPDIFVFEITERDANALFTFTFTE